MNPLASGQGSATNCPGPAVAGAPEFRFDLARLPGLHLAGTCRNAAESLRRPEPTGNCYWSS